MTNITKRIIIWAMVVCLILLVPFIAMQFSGEVNWSLFDFIFMGALLFGIGLLYELVARRSNKTMYRVAFGLGLLGGFLLIWINGAVGIIGNEANSANLMYGAVLLAGLIGSLVARFKPRGMAYTLFTTALIQLLVPIIALFIWSPKIVSWGGLGVFGVFVLNFFFVILFTISAGLFYQVSKKE